MFGINKAPDIAIDSRKGPISCWVLLFPYRCQKSIKNAYKEENITPRDIFSSFPKEKLSPPEPARDRVKKRICERILS